MREFVRSTASTKSQRFIEIDLLRGSAIVIMVIYHLIFDLIQVAKIPSFVPIYFWRVGPEIISGMFLLSSGLSTQVRFERTGLSSWQVSKKQGFKVLGAGLALTVATFSLETQYVIVFGILHCIGVSILLGHWALRFRAGYIIGFSVLVILTGWSLEAAGLYQWSVDWLKAHLLEGRIMMDYFPLVPWFGYYVLGIGIAKLLATKFFGQLARRKAYLPLIFLSRWSLWIYLIHQPLLLGGLWAMGVL